MPTSQGRGETWRYHIRIFSVQHWSEREQKFVSHFAGDAQPYTEAAPVAEQLCIADEAGNGPDETWPNEFGGQELAEWLSGGNVFFSHRRSKHEEKLPRAGMADGLHHVYLLLSQPEFGNHFEKLGSLPSSNNFWLTSYRNESNVINTTSYQLGNDRYI